jgi:hypothetical protein
MDDGRKMTALPLNEVRERLLSKRQDAFGTPQRASNPVPAAIPSSAPPKRPHQVDPPLEERICAYSKCSKKFTPRRPDQRYHSADCRKRAWFDRNFVAISRPEGQ